MDTYSKSKMDTYGSGLKEHVLRPESKMKPIYEHDCDHCEYLGSVHGLADSNADAYRCGKQGGGPGCYILRFSSDGPDYSSWTPKYVRLFQETTHFGDTTGMLTYSAYHLVVEMLARKADEG
jgi:hypothetical protein